MLNKYRSVTRGLMTDSSQHHVAGEVDDKQKADSNDIGLSINQCATFRVAINQLGILVLPNTVI